MSDGGLYYIQQIVAGIFAIFLGLSVHEYAHALAAKSQGDITADHYGRLTLNPIAHIDPVGTILLPFILLLSSGGRVAYGWAKPVPVNPMAFRHPRRGVFIVSLAGPASNIALALAAGVAFRLTYLGGPSGAFQPLQLVLISIVSINLYLAFFNLIPIPPLDGSGVVSALLPVELAVEYEKLGRIGMFLILALIILGSLAGFSIIGLIIVPPARALRGLFTGLPY